MAELSVFAYQPGSGGLYRCDVRFKLLALLLLTISLTGGRPAGLLATCLALSAGLCRSRVPMGALVREMRLFAAFLAFVWLVRALGTPGRTLLALGPLTLTVEGVVQGGLVCWRMLTVLLAGLLFVRTTRMAEVRAATAWLLRPVPFLDAQQAAALLGLMVRFIPVILTQARETRQAQQARCIDGRRNPLYRLTALGLPLMRSVLLRSERIATAMSARGYCGRTTPYAFASRPWDWALLGLAALLAAGHLLG